MQYRKTPPYGNNEYVYLELSYKTLGYEKLCVNCSLPRTKQFVLSCGHRNYCDTCINGIKKCSTCNESVNVIQLRALHD